MMAIRPDPRVTFAAAALLLCTTASAQLATGEFERTLDIGEPVALEVMTGSGSIDVRQGSASEVRVQGRITVSRNFGRSRADAADVVNRLESDPPIVVTGNQIVIGRITDETLARNVSISYTVVVPTDTSAKSRTGSGNQSLSGLSGAVEAVSGSGSIRVDRVGGDVNLRTGSGSIDARAIEGDFTARTGSGSIRLTASGAGDVDVTSGSGRIQVSGFDGALHARAGSGSIVAEGRPSGAWEAQTGSGSIVVRLPSGVGFDIDARTGSGGIHVEQPVTTTGSIRRNSLSGSVDGGGQRLGLRTGSGSIRIEQQQSSE